MESILNHKKDVYKSIYPDIPVFDCHTHVMNGIGGVEKLSCMMELFNFSKMNVLSISGMGDIGQNLKCMLFKTLHSPGAYAFGGLVHPYNNPGDGVDYCSQAKRLMSMGFDGMKMIEGKPEARKKLKEPLDHRDFDRYYEFLEAERIPVLFHIADPETFWDINKVPKWALDNGWFYGSGEYNSKEELYGEVHRILEKFPKLKAIFAHLSADLDRASNFLDEFENVSFDLTPGTEMYVNFSKDPERTREFFVKYQDRIMFGTDICDPIDDTELHNMISTVNLSRMFLETDRNYQVWDLNINGIGLGRQILKKIYYENMLRYVGKIPKKADMDSVRRECARIGEMAGTNSDSDDTAEELDRILKRLNGLA